MNQLTRQALTNGYQSSSSPLAVREGALVSGSSNLIPVGQGRLRVYKGALVQASVAGGRAMFALPSSGYASLGTAAAAGKGSVIGLIARAFAYIGTGALYLDGVSRSVSASTALQIILYRAGSYSGANTGPYLAGLEPPTAPTTATTPTASSAQFTGTTAVVVWFVRSATGGRSRKSTPSAVLVVDGTKMRVTIDAADLTYASSVGADRLGIGVTALGFGATGPFYEYTEIALSSLTTVDGAANSYEFEYVSAQLSGAPLAPLDDYPPPAGVFATAIEDAIAVIGCYGDVTSGVTADTPGTAIAVSLPVYIESFPPDNLLYLPEAPVGVLPPSDSVSFIGCKNSMHALRYTGGSPAMSLQSVWATTGIAHQNNFWLGEGGRLYAQSNGQLGLVRIGRDSEPETEWARDISEDVKTWTPANVCGGWDNNTQLNVIAHGRQLFAYSPQNDSWSAPLSDTEVLTANEVYCGATTRDGTLYLAARDTVTTANPIRLFRFDGGTGRTFEARLGWASSPAYSDTITAVDVALRADNTANPIVIKIYKDGDSTTPSATISRTPTRTGLQHLRDIRANVRGARSHQIGISGTSTGGDAGVDVVATLGETSGVRF